MSITGALLFPLYWLILVLRRREEKRDWQSKYFDKKFAEGEAGQEEAAKIVAISVH